MPLNEANTRLHLIDPVLKDQRGWKHDGYYAIRAEERDAAVEIINGKARRRATKPKDYVLYWDCTGGTTPRPLAILEAKKESLPPDHGLQQAMDYRKGALRHVPTVFSSNGHLFVRYDEKTGQTSDPVPMADFPRPEDLCGEQTQFLGFSPTEPAAKPWTALADLGPLKLRYYQDAAARATLQKIVLADKEGANPRALLPMATGSGKTKLAVAILKRLDAAGRIARALFVCDRDPLRSSALAALQQVFGTNADEVSTRNAQPNAKVLVATYQTLGFTPVTEEPEHPVDDDGEPSRPYKQSNAKPGAVVATTPPADEGSFFVRNYPENYFDVIVIDECHRSAWGKWRMILDRNPRAIHIGLTATPREIKLPEVKDADTATRIEEDARLIADNFNYFGEPVYEYDYLQGVEDGYLAPCQILTFDIYHDDHAQPERLRGVQRPDVVDKEVTNALTGQKLPPEAVEEKNAPSRIDATIILPERVKAFARHFFDELLARHEGDPHQKTIIFCQSDLHARRVAKELNNLHAAWCIERKARKVPKFAFQCTASTNGQESIPDFRARPRSHFIATTVDLLSTGVDVPCVRHIVFLRFLQSPILFHQMIGRGTRIDEGTGKLMFTIWDYTGATSLFGADLITPPPPRPPTEPPPVPPPPPPPGPPPVQVKGTAIEIREAGEFLAMQVEGRLQRVTVEQYRARLTEKLLALSPDLADFRRRWLDRETHHELLQTLEDQGLNVARLPEATQEADYDLFDLLAALVFGAEPRKRSERAAAFLAHSPDWLVRLPQPAAEVVKKIVRQFEAGGVGALETTELFRQISVPGQDALTLLKQAGMPAEILQKTKEGLFVA